jgi:spore coat polysaccharide biosynthesis protein SpsF
VRTAIFLSSRNKATRLPGKVLLPLAGRPMTERLIERLSTATAPDLVVLTTSTHSDDDVLVDLASACGIETFRGSEDDKLDRYLQAARHFGVEIAAIVDGDDPLCDPGYIDRLLATMARAAADYGYVAHLPVGVTANAVRRGALERVCDLKAERDTEVWGGYFMQSALFTTCVIEADLRHRAPDLRLTLDYPEDYALFSAIFETLAANGSTFTLDDVFELLAERPELEKLNAGVVAQYDENLKRITRITFRDGVAGH